MDDSRLSLEKGERGWQLTMSGRWTLGEGIPDPMRIAADAGDGAAIEVDAGGVVAWDTSAAAFLRELEQQASARGGTVEIRTAPPGLGRLLGLARAPLAAPPAKPPLPPLLELVGRRALWFRDRVGAWFALIGALSVATVRFALGRARVSRAEILLQIEESGARALPIVTLLSFLIGGIVAFVGVVQLRVFGAEIFVADLVAMGMLLEMGALMTAVIMAGRAGASFAAALGTMQTNEEVDALSTIGVDPVEYLLLPRMLALTLMVPLLTLYADALGILGGAFVGVTMLDISPSTYFSRTADAMALSDAVKGLIKSVAFGALIALAGCIRGIECGRSAQAVGRATTSAVVTAIVLIVVADAFITVLIFVYEGMV
jgi:phospholipid/cholesterol/gamma-HCH transport system permease protein